MVEWLMVVVLMGGDGAPKPQAVTQVGPFKSQAACEAAAKVVTRQAFARTICVTTDVAPG